MRWLLLGLMIVVCGCGKTPDSPFKSGDLVRHVTSQQRMVVTPGGAWPRSSYCSWVDEKGAHHWESFHWSTLEACEEDGVLYPKPKRGEQEEN